MGIEHGAKRPHKIPPKPKPGAKFKQLNIRVQPHVLDKLRHIAGFQAETVADIVRSLILREYHNIKRRKPKGGSL